MNKNVHWIKLTHLLSLLSVNFRVPFLYIYQVYSKILLAFLNIKLKDNHLSLRYTLYANASNSTPFYTHISSYVV